VVKFCSKHKLVLLADEVYQQNVYDDKVEFVSCKRVAYEMGLIKDDGIELVSFHSISKGIYGECGLRGGYMELVGIDEIVKEHLYKLASAGLCSNVSGQIMMSLMARGPKPVDVSYKSHEIEKNAIYSGLKRRSIIAFKGLNRIPGISCQKAQGAMYCFPKIDIPQSAIEEAKKKAIAPDTMYALSLLEKTGICVVPASGFGQKKGRYGFRTTFLPLEKEMERVVKCIGVHHEEFCKKYS